MKKISVLVALALLVVAGTGYAVTCAQDNVPGATLLVPYFRVGGVGADVNTGIPGTSGPDTLCAVTNVSSAKIMTHVTVWNKFSRPVLDFNVPMTGYDVYVFSMRDVLNGHLNLNPAAQPVASGVVFDSCKSVDTTLGGFQNYVRFTSPQILGRDKNAISIYQDPAFTGAFRNRVWSSLDESGDVSDWNAGSTFVFDKDNWVCDLDGTTPHISGDFSGYVTIDVANYCSLTFPSDGGTYSDSAIATSGWGSNGVVSGGPNVLFGDVFYKDQALNTGNISGDPMVALEFDSRLTWFTPGVNRTFYGRYAFAYVSSAPAAFSFGNQGDGREPLGQRYGFRFLQDTVASSLRTWALVYRQDVYYDAGIATDTNLCGWWEYWSSPNQIYPYTDGFTDKIHQITVTARDNDEHTITTSGGPSGGPGGLNQYIFLETQRMVISPNTQVVLGTWAGGWIDLTMPGGYNEQAWVGVQHTGAGLAMTVGHSAALLNGNSVCSPAFNLNIVTN